MYTDKIVKNITISNNVAKILHCIAGIFASLFLVDKLHIDLLSVQLGLLSNIDWLETIYTY